MKNVRIGHQIVGDGNPIQIIAEIGGNFRTFPEAKKLIDLAANAGADMVKLQTYRAETISSKSAMFSMRNTGNVDQFSLFKKYEIDLGLHKEIWDYCAELNLFVCSTPSHMSDVELLEKLDCGVYKIGADDAVNLPFLREVAKIGKPIILSTGMCTMAEVDMTVSEILGAGNSDLVLLHCVTDYPTDIDDVNLLSIPEMKRRFGLPVGFSDHTIGTLACLTAASIGANVLEKHFTFDKNADGPDHILSADPVEFAEIVCNTRLIEKALGDGVKRPSKGEKQTRINNRKSVVSLIDIPKGTVIRPEMVAIKRPGMGIAPKDIDLVIGRTAQRDIAAEEPIFWDAV